MYGDCLQMWLSHLFIGGRTLVYPNFLCMLLFLVLYIVFGIGLEYMSKHITDLDISDRISSGLFGVSSQATHFTAGTAGEV